MTIDVFFFYLLYIRNYLTKNMTQDDIESIVELLEDGIKIQDWDLVEEALQYIQEFNPNRKLIISNSNNNDDED